MEGKMEIGVDIVDLERIEKVYSRYGMKFLRKFLSGEEINLCLHKPQVIASLAGRFAAKEAVVKALGTGFSGKVHWKSFEILNDRRGRPFVRLVDSDCFPAGCSIKISIAHDRHAAVATALLERA
ncbi:holo-(acyl-carrier-protein) synthase:phosphopantethiene--protein transferase domain [Chlorobium ferrooxidans DSM 13031]|uniref:Holo-[acyl-carrier-protein] synthase n=2 Tax=Chlorobium TaxID=1091 RepID=Q0YRT8_9CHLB|nr:holo-(acyl-carrier-protein) synthase:phosphopantethiene--protein transferase domain [Chlorobium ferrooxidans DSM 13031]